MIVYADGLQIQAAVLIDISNITELNSNSVRKKSSLKAQKGSKLNTLTAESNDFL